MSIELKNVTYTYSPGTSYEIHALKDINLNIPDGQFIGVIGHTGSGKSTLIQHLNALIRPTSGTVSYNGEDVWAENYNRRALRSEVGLVFQYPEYQLFEETVAKDIAFGTSTWTTAWTTTPSWGCSVTKTTTYGQHWTTALHTSTTTPPLCC